MSGSYRHIVDCNGLFRGMDLIDNLGDAYEALEECFMIIKYLSGGDKLKIYDAWLKGYFEKIYPDYEKYSKGLASYEEFWSDD